MAANDKSSGIDAVAADWAARVDSGPLSDAEQEALDDWLARSTRHLGAYARASAILVAAGMADASASADRDAGEVIVEAGAEPQEAANATIFDRRRALAAGGAGLLILSAGAFLLFDSSEVHATERGEIRTVRLADGSALTLNTQSRVRVTYRSQQRLIEIEQGEALIEAGLDERNPLVVAAAAIELRGLGGTLAVRRTGGTDALISVLSGNFAMRSTVGLFEQIALAPLTRCAVAGGLPGAARTMQKLEFERANAWREGMIFLDGATLGEAAREFARYSDQRLLFDGGDTSALRISGYFDLTDLPGFAQASALSLELKMSRVGGDLRLEKR